MRCFERMLRRAQLPYHSTEGFNPKPRLVFALSLGLGIVGREEIVDLELDEVLPTEEILRRLAQQAPTDLEILQIDRIDPKTTAQVRRVCYRVAIPRERHAGLSERICEMLAEAHCWVERTRPQPRRLDIRGYIRDLKLCENDLEMDLEVTPQGTARPDEILQVLGLGDLLANGAVLERSTLEIHHEDSSRLASEVSDDPSRCRLPGGTGSPRQGGPSRGVDTTGSPAPH
jgi:radical SAM-linked protein